MVVMVAVYGGFIIKQVHVVSVWMAPEISTMLLYLLQNSGYTLDLALATLGMI